MTWARLFGCMAWFWFMVPILQSAWILSRGGKRLVGTHVLLGSVSYTNFFFVFAYTNLFLLLNRNHLLLCTINSKAGSVR